MSEIAQLKNDIINSRERIPQHVGVIMDGNRRWAQKHMLSLLKGYSSGAEQADDLCHWAMGLGIKVLSLWAWSTENFNRDDDQKSFIMDLFREYLSRYLKNDFLVNNNIEFKAIGRIDWMPADIQNLAHELEDKTKGCTAMRLQGCIAYGGQQEIVDSVREIAAEVKAGKITLENIDAALLTQKMYFSTPDPDLVIRTGGECRTSGFLLWHSDYSEWFFSDKLFPDFTETDFLMAVSEYQQRQRRFGK